MAKTGGGIPSPIYNRMKKVKENVSMRVQDWNKAVDKFSTRGSNAAPGVPNRIKVPKPIANKPIGPGGVRRAVKAR